MQYLLSECLIEQQTRERARERERETTGPPSSISGGGGGGGGGDGNNSGHRDRRGTPSLIRRLLPLPALGGSRSGGGGARAGGNNTMGGTSSKLDKALKEVPENVKIFGLENFGATCYCNSVLQALYFCRDFRVKLLEYYNDAINTSDIEHEDSLLLALGELFSQIHSQKKKTGTIAPRKFVARLKKVLFRIVWRLFQFYGLISKLIHEFTVKMPLSRRKLMEMPALIGSIFVACRLLKG